MMMQQVKEEEDYGGIERSIKIIDLRTGRRALAFRALLLVSLCMLAISSLVQQFFNINHARDSNKPSATSMVANRRASQEFYEQDSLNGENSFSACLLWMDDNGRLIEWLAYHYHVLPLRYLVLLIDQNSTTSPNPVLDKWRNLMTIVLWNNTDEVLLQKSKDAIDDCNKASTMCNSHFERYLSTQRDFYRKCTAHMKAHNRTWTAYIDTDEFILLDARQVKNVKQRLEKPGAVLALIKEFHALNKTKGESQFEQNCFFMARKEIGAVESSPEHVVKDVPPNMLDQALRFQTLRFRHQHDKSIIGKSIMDVSKFTDSELTNTSYSAHRIIKECGNNPWGGSRSVQLYVNHYIGSWEAYQRPNDFRNAVARRDSWHVKANVSGGKFYTGDEIRPWLQSFVNYFGNETSQYLLDNVGYPYNASTALHVL